MAEKRSSTEQYLVRLAEGLEALGPEETNDVIAEVRAHLAEALADSGGDEDAVLNRFGGSDALATSILEERGFFSDHSGMPEVPLWLRLLALLVDVALWAAGLAIVLVPVLGFAWVASTPSATAIALTWAALALAVVGSAWWRIRRWRAPGRPTMGMRLLGVRRIRVGGTSRIVLERDVPGSAGRRRVWPLVLTALAVFVLASIVSSAAVSLRSQMESRIRNAVSDASTGQSMIEGLYGSVLAGAKTSDLQGSYAPSTEGAISDLVQRQAAGKIESYNVSGVELGDYDHRLGDWTATSYTIVVFVPVQENGKDPYAVGPTYRWKVVCQMVDEGNGVSGGEWLIESADLVKTQE